MREFIGWDRPALPRAAARLADHYAAGDELRMDRAVVVTPAGRPGRRLTELLLEEAAARELRLVPPRLATPGALPELLYQPDAPPADAATARRAWARALAGTDPQRLAAVFPHAPAPVDLRAWSGLARQLHQYHREIAGEGLRFAQVAERCRADARFDDGDRWQVLAEVQQRYLAALRAAGRVDPDLARLAALDAGRLGPGPDVWLVGVTQMPAVLRRMLRSLESPVRALVHAPEDRAHGFDDDGCVLPTAWLEAPIPLADERLDVVDRPADQALAAARAVERLDGRLAAEEITIGAADPELVPFLEQRLSACDLPVRYAGGLPLGRTDPYRLLAAAAEYLDGRRFESLAALIRHPALGARLRALAADGRAPVLRELDGALLAADRYFAEHLPSRADGRPPRVGAWVAPFAALREAVEHGTLLGGFGGRRRLAEWAGAVLELLVTVYGGSPLDREDPADRRLLAALEAIRDAAQAFHRLPAGLDAECDAATAIRLLLSEVDEAEVPPEPDRAAIELLGWLELHLDDAPALVVAGFNEPFLPSSVNADVLLPNSLRTRLGLLDNDTRYARDAYQLTAILHSRPHVHVIAGRRTGSGDPLRPSRLMFTVRGPALARRVLRFYGDEPGAVERGTAAAAVSAAATAAPAAPGPGEAASPVAAPGFVLPPEPRLSAPEPLDSLSVTDFRLLLRDPYRFALERVLRLETLDDAARELDPLGFGTLAHDVLQRFGAGDEVQSADEASIRRRLDALLDAVAEERFGRDPLPAVRIQLEQLRVRFRAFAGWQADWIAEGWRVAAVEGKPPAGAAVAEPGPGRTAEVRFDVDDEPIRLRGRIDRIDHHPGRDEWAVFDYKTSDRPDGPEQAHRRGRGSNRQWVDLQLPLYRHLLAAVAAAGGRPLVPPAARDRVRLGYILLPREPEGTGHLFAEWGPADLAAADEAAREAVRLVRANVFEFDPSKAAGYRGTPLANLVGLGRLGAGEQDAGEADAREEG